jgi:hypothetical protein
MASDDDALLIARAMYRTWSMSLSKRSPKEHWARMTESERQVALARTREEEASIHRLATET